MLPARDQNRFVDHLDAHRSLCAVKFPFSCSDENDERIAQCNVQFVVIEVELPFLIDLPSLMAMKARISFKFKKIGLNFSSKYIRIHITQNDVHILLPLLSTIKRYERGNAPNRNGSGNHYSMSTFKFLSSYHQPTDSTNPVMGQHTRSPGIYTTTNSNRGIRFTAAETLKRHIQLKHGSVGEVRNSLKTSELWYNEILLLLNSILSSCKYQLVNPRNPHPVANTSPVENIYNAT